MRDDRDQESRLKLLSASFFYRVFNKIVDSIQLREGAGDQLVLLDAAAVKAITSMCESSRFSKGSCGGLAIEQPHCLTNGSNGKQGPSPEVPSSCLVMPSTEFSRIQCCLSGSGQGWV